MCFPPFWNKQFSVGFVCNFERVMTQHVYSLPVQVLCVITYRCMPVQSRMHAGRFFVWPYRIHDNLMSDLEWPVHTHLYLRASYSAENDKSPMSFITVPPCSCICVCCHSRHCYSGTRRRLSVQVCVSVCACVSVDVLCNKSNNKTKQKINRTNKK